MISSVKEVICVGQMMKRQKGLAPGHSARDTFCHIYRLAAFVIQASLSSCTTKHSKEDNTVRQKVCTATFSLTPGNSLINDSRNLLRRRVVSCSSIG